MARQRGGFGTVASRDRRQLESVTDASGGLIRRPIRTFRAGGAAPVSGYIPRFARSFAADMLAFLAASFLAASACAAADRAAVLVRLARLEAGNMDDCKSLGGGLQELRIDHGPGYRVYFARIGKEVLLLLCAGDKRSQSRDIKAARASLADYKRRTGTSEGR